MEQLIQNINGQGIEPVFEDTKSINLFFSFNDNFVKYFAVSLQSIIENSSSENRYDIVVLVSSLKKENIDILKKMLPSNFSLRFFNISDFIDKNFDGIEFKFAKEFSVETYYRLFVPFVSKQYDKVLYLDSDIILNNGWEDIFKIDLEGAQVLVVQDTISNQLDLECNKKFLKYLVNELNLSNEKEYFNAGVVLFNIKNIDDNRYLKKLLEALKIKNLVWQDQDVLNVIFNGSTKNVSPKWNFNCGQFAFNDDYLNYLSDRKKNEMIEAIEDAKIFHFSTSTKPWIYKDIRYGDIFWKYAQKTFFYEELNSNIVTREMKYKKLMSFAEKENIVLWGASLILEDILKYYNVSNSNIMGIIDNNIEKSGQVLGNYKIFSPAKLEELKPNTIIITIANQQSKRIIEIKEFLKENNLNNIKIECL